MSAIIGILASLILASVAKAKPKANQALCLSNLRQSGMAFQMFANDHNNRLPSEISTNLGGASEFCPRDLALAEIPEVFSALSNELVNPKVLFCPSDLGRSPSLNFALFGRTNLSYFAGLKGSMQQPGSVLAGDRNVELYGSALRWTSGIHESRGDLLFADGHAEKRVSWEMPLIEVSTNGTTTTTTTTTGAGGSGTASPSVNRQKNTWNPSGFGSGEEERAKPSNSPASQKPRMPAAIPKKHSPTPTAAAPARPELAQSSETPEPVTQTPKVTAPLPTSSTSGAHTADDEETDSPIMRLAQLAIMAGSCFSLLLAVVILLMMALKKLRDRRLRLGDTDKVEF